ncbi:MAG: tRNA-dihydrouridine(20) synthase [NAD(P)+]-like protein [Marteilia pararefringens]
MVRVGHVSMRLLCLHYGADLVYSNEIIDESLLLCERSYNDALKTHDFFCKLSGACLLRVHDDEKNKLIIQLGTKNPQKALKCAKMVEDIVCGIDINMGCPKLFSTKGGRGSALLKHPDQIKDLLCTLVSNLSIAVACKIRVLYDLESTLDLVREILKTGIHALAVHGRTDKETYSTPNRGETIIRIKEISNIPIIANGFSSEDWIPDKICDFRRITMTDSLMVGRKALANPSIFSQHYEKDIDVVIRKFLGYAEKYYENFNHIIFCVTKFIKYGGSSYRKQEDLLKCKSIDELLQLWDMDSNDSSDSYRKLHGIPNINEIGNEYEFVEEKDMITLPVRLLNLSKIKSEQNVSPKGQINTKVYKNSKKYPIYEHISNGKYFKTKLTLDDKTYCSSLWNKSKKYSDNASAIVYLKYIELNNY